jgi:hypothetical protein
MSKLWDEDVDQRRICTLDDLEIYLAEKASMALYRWVESHGIDNLMSDAVEGESWVNAPLSYTSILNFFEMYLVENRNELGNDSWKAYDFLMDIDEHKSREHVRHSNSKFKTANRRLRGIPTPQEVAAKKRIKK